MAPSRRVAVWVGVAGAGRHCKVIDRLVDAVRGGESRVLVARGELGVGTSALLGYLAERARCGVARAGG
jgi:hypothetical protein